MDYRCLFLAAAAALVEEEHAKRVVNQAGVEAEVGVIAFEGKNRITDAIVVNKILL